MSELGEISQQLRLLVDQSKRLHQELLHASGSAVRMERQRLAAEAARPGPEGKRAKRAMAALDTAVSEIRNGEQAIARVSSVADRWLAQHGSTKRGGARAPSASGRNSGSPAATRRSAAKQARSQQARARELAARIDKDKARLLEQLEQDEQGQAVSQGLEVLSMVVEHLGHVPGGIPPAVGELAGALVAHRSELRAALQYAIARMIGKGQGAWATVRRVRAGRW